ncbi:FAD-binding domain-containing protein [Anaeromyces robustus]|jgi:D-lactate dehydrogenase (cytochrome)|uniref:D-lactate dehydrogenase (cytochrome) n=1 Tax=Anaeromyces robustus TaxID=1754192 RepID=A0A1Y1X2H5_9FUNG|nr:FAD-binding domain-containing protein [Anaeromyces robustus]|eukprot:ORX79838.1 FAD-binding domain-containing protein [Anaeromyces robustus]
MATNNLEEIEFTANHYSNLIRDERYNRLTKEHVEYFKSILPKDNVICSLDDSEETKKELLKYNIDWMKKYRGQSQLVLLPTSTDEVSQCLRYCNENNLAVVPQSGNSGLVGGSVPVFDEIIISTKAMNKIIDFDDVSGVLTCNAGCVLADLEAYVEERGFMVPLDMGSKKYCCIGGNVSSNAGGLRYLRYGSLHSNVLGLEVVLANGQVIDNLSKLRKDSTGYDIKQLFIGAEGTLGIITNVAISTPRKPKAVNAVFLSTDSWENVQAIYKTAKEHLQEIISAFEFFDEDAYSLVKQHMQLQVPLKEENKFYVLVETHGSNKQHDNEKLHSFLEAIKTSNVAREGYVSKDDQQTRSFWIIRESVPVACSKNGAVFKYDLSIPIAQIYDVAIYMRKYLKEANVYRPGDETSEVINVAAYGHIGDGNIHINISCKSYSEEIANLIEPEIFYWTRDHNGVISGEHGLGLMKGKYLAISKPGSMIRIMESIKNILDPNYIMNPYKYLPKKRITRLSDIRS